MVKPVDETQVSKLVRAHVLGQLDGYEERLMSDDEFFRAEQESREVVLDELVDDYVSGNLTDDDRRAFKERLLPSPEVRARLGLGHALLALGKRQHHRIHWQERFRSWIQPLPTPVPALAACLMLVLTVGVWSTLRVGELQTQLGEATSQQTQLTAARDALHSQLADERQSSSRMAEQLATATSQLLDIEASLKRIRAQGIAVLASFILKPGLQRGEGELTRVEISSRQRVVELKLDLGLDEYQSYRIALNDSAGNEVLTLANLQAASSGEDIYVICQMPTHILRSDDYQVRLRGVTANQQVEMIDSFHFRVRLQ